MQWETGGNQAQDGEENRVERTFLPPTPGLKTETDFQRKEKYRGFIMEMGSPGTQCLPCDLVIDTRFVDEAYILHQPTACGCCIR